jgi:hypothetical protein
METWIEPGLEFASGSFTVHRQDGQERRVFRGVLHPKALHLVQSEPHHVAPLDPAVLPNLTLSVQRGRVRDIVLGIRGYGLFQQGTSFFTSSPTYLIEGFSQLLAARRLKAAGEEPYIGCRVELGTNPDNELEMFMELNHPELVGVRSASANLREYAVSHPVVGEILKLTADPTFPLFGRVAWMHPLPGYDIVTAYGLAVASGHLNRRQERHGRDGEDARSLADWLQAEAQSMGTEQFICNLRTFVAAITESCKLSVDYQTNEQFFGILARLFGQHHDVWEQPSPDGRRLSTMVVNEAIRERLAAFPVEHNSYNADFGRTVTAGRTYDALLRHFRERGLARLC